MSWHVRKVESSMTAKQSSCGHNKTDYLERGNGDRRQPGRRGAGVVYADRRHRCGVKYKRSGTEDRLEQRIGVEPERGGEMSGRQREKSKGKAAMATISLKDHTCTTAGNNGSMSTIRRHVDSCL
jgi:hypothetical protein